jgi:hypothetical protein
VVPYLTCVGAALTVLVAFVGWGSLTCRVIGRYFARGGLRCDLGLQAGIGLAVTICVFGFVVAAGGYSRPVLVAWLVTGLSAAVVGEILPRFRDVWLTGPGYVLTAGLGLLAASQTAFALRAAPWNSCDDDVAYLYLVRRLIATGSMLEPFSQRRIASYGGQTALQGIVVDFLGNRAVQIFDLVAAPLLIFLLFVAPRRRVSVAAGGGLLLMALLLSVNAQINLSPLYSAAALLLTGFRLCSQMADAPEDADRSGPAVGLGIVAAALLALRLNFLFPLIVVLALTTLLCLRGLHVSARVVLIAGAVAVGGVSGWALALWRSSRTFLFPIMAGTLNRSWPGYRDPEVDSLGDYVHHLSQALRDTPTRVAMAAVLALAVLAFTANVSRSKQALVALSGLVAFVGTVLALTAFFTIAIPADVRRFSWPILTTSALFAIGASIDATTTGPSESASDRLRPKYPPTSVRTTLTWVLALLAVCALSNQSPRSLIDGARTRLSVVRSAIADNTALADRYRDVMPDYRRTEGSLPPAARVVVAVDFPAIFGTRAERLQNLDIIGSNSPPPGMPFFQGPGAKLEFLASLGNTHLVVVDPASSACLYRRDSWVRNAQGAAGKVYQQWAPYFLDWLSDTERYAAPGSTGVTRFGALLLVDIKAALGVTDWPPRIPSRKS